MERGTLPQSRLVGNKIEQRTPCGKHVIYFPAMLAARAAQKGIYSVFMTSCECGTVYLVTTEDDAAHFRMDGPSDAISDLYEAFPWPETELAEGFFFKTPPSLAELKARFQDGPSPTSN